MSQYKFEVSGWDTLPDGEYLVSVGEETATLAYRESRLDRWSRGLVPSEVTAEPSPAITNVRAFIAKLRADGYTALSSAWVADMLEQAIGGES